MPTPSIILALDARMGFPHPEGAVPSLAVEVILSGSGRVSLGEASW